MYQNTAVYRIRPIVKRFRMAEYRNRKPKEERLPLVKRWQKGKQEKQMELVINTNKKYQSIYIKKVYK